MTSLLSRQSLRGHRTGRTALLSLVLLATSALASAQQGYLGAVFDFMDPMASAQYGLNFGAVVVRGVVPGSPAEKAGLRPGDIVTSIDGVPMRNPNQVVDAIHAHRPGDKARAGIVHPMGSRNLSLEIAMTIGRAPSNGQGSQPGYGPANAPSSPGNGQYSGAPQSGYGQQGGYGRQQGNQPWQGSGGGHARPITQAQLAQRVQQGPCRAAVPQGWQLAPGPNGQSADVYGPNGAHAAWGIAGINPAMRQYYGNMYGPPDVHSAALLSMMVQAQAQFVSSENIGNFFTGHEFRAGNSAGIVLYHVYPAQMGQYIISEYFAWAPQGDAALLSQAEAVMTTLQCTSSIRPSKPYTYTPHTGGSDRKRSTGSAEGDSLKDYNSILGTQYAHDPSTGQVYCLDRSQMSDTGPEGAGYYVGTGVNRHRLDTGVE